MFNYRICWVSVEQELWDTQSAPEQIVNYHPQATVTALLFLIIVDKSLEVGFRWGVEYLRLGG